MSTRGPFLVRPYWQHSGGHPVLHLLVFLVDRGAPRRRRHLALPPPGAAAGRRPARLATAGAPPAPTRSGSSACATRAARSAPDEFRRMSVDLGAAPDAFGPASAASEAPAQPGGPDAPAA